MKRTEKKRTGCASGDSVACKTGPCQHYTRESGIPTAAQHVESRNQSTRGGGLLKTAVTVASQSGPLSPQQLPPPLMPTILSATRSVFEPAQHCALFEKVANCLMRHFRAHIPYRMPLNIPLIQPVMKCTLRKILHTVKNISDYWPVHLREYVKDALVIVSKRSRKVGQLLATTLTSRFPTAWLESDLTGPCPCQALPDTPRVAWSHGHTFFRDPAVLLTLCQECET